MNTLALALLLSVGYVDNPQNMCSGALIGPRTVLTAAHCVSGYPTREIRFTLSPDTNKGTPIFSVAESVTIHPAYKRSTSESPAVADVALVELSSTQYGTEPREFLAVRQPSSGEPGIAAGYGYNPDGSNGARRERPMRYLKAVDVVGAHGEKFPSGMIYFGRGGNGTITCGGDSGGPVIGRALDGKIGIVGITGQGSVDTTLLRKNPDGTFDTSPTALCRAKDTTHVTSMAAFRDWVESTRKAIETPARSITGR